MDKKAISAGIYSPKVTRMLQILQEYNPPLFHALMQTSEQGMVIDKDLENAVDEMQQIIRDKGGANGVDFKTTVNIIGRKIVELIKIKRAENADKLITKEKHNVVSEIVSEMVKIANAFDDMRFYKEADDINDLIIKIAQFGMINSIESMVKAVTSPEMAKYIISTQGKGTSAASKQLVELLLQKFPGLAKVVSTGVGEAAATGGEVAAGAETAAVGGAEVAGGVAAGGLMAAAASIVSTFLAAYGITRFIMSHTGGDKWVTEKLYNLLKAMGYSDAKIPNKQQMLAIAHQNKDKLLSGVQGAHKPAGQSMQQGAAGAVQGIQSSGAK